MNEIVFPVKVTAIHPAYDNQGNEYICIEFGFRPPRIPTMIPTSVPDDVSEMIKASRDVVKVMVPSQLQAQWRTYANRLSLFLTLDEWENLQQKYTVSDEFNITIQSNGNIVAKKL